MEDTIIQLPRCGDHVLHRPSGETWVVAWAESGRLAWAGWPDGIAALIDCEITYHATDDEHRKAVNMWRDLSIESDSRPSRVLRLYGKN